MPSPAVERKNKQLVIGIAAAITVLFVIAGSFGGYMAYKSYHTQTEMAQLKETRAMSASNPEGLLNAAAAADEVEASESVSAPSPSLESSSNHQQVEQNHNNYDQASVSTAKSSSSSITTKQPRGSTAALVALVLIFVSILLTAMGLIGYKLYTDKLERERLAAEAAEQERLRLEELELQRSGRAYFRVKEDDHILLMILKEVGNKVISLVVKVLYWVVVGVLVFGFLWLISDKNPPKNGGNKKNFPKGNKFGK